MNLNLFKNKRVVLVGPSPHLLGKNLGKFIDSFDVVVRVNEIGVTSDLYDDYGSRTNVAFLSLYSEVIPYYREMIHNVNYDELKLIVHPGDEYNLNPYTNEKTESAKKYFDLLNIDIAYHQIVVPSISETSKFFGCYPSTGSLTMIELLNQELKELYVCGFSFYLTKYRYHPTKIEWWRIPDQNKHKHNLRQGGHDTRKEVIALRKLLRSNSIVNGDKLFNKVIMSKNMGYYELRRFINYKLNLDNFKNILKILLRKIGIKI